VIGRSTTRAAAAAAALAAAALAGAGSAEAAPAPATKAARAFQGAMEVDVRTGSGKLLGHLHGHIARSGRGHATLEPAYRRPHAGEVVVLRARSRRAGAAVRLRGLELHGRARIDRGGAVSGRARHDGKRVRLVGVARERLPRLRRGLRMLVVGRPRGEGYRALARYFRPVRYRRGRHRRQSFLRDRRAFHRYGALVFGPGASRRKVEAHRLLRPFYRAGKWVVVAPAPRAAQEAVGAVHAYVHRRPAAAIAVRSAGPRGSHHLVKPTVVYPDPPTLLGARLTPVERRAAARRRSAWFLDELRKYAPPHLRPGRGVAVARAALSENRPAASAASSAASGTSVTGLTDKSQAIVVPVGYSHEFTLGDPENVTFYKTCGWNTTTLNAWCPDTSLYQEQFRGDAVRACQWFLSNGYRLVDPDAVYRATGGQKNEAGAYTFHDDAPVSFQQWGGDSCPQRGNQTGRLQGSDTYYAFALPNEARHALIAVTDPSISAVDGTSTMFKKPGDSNGTGTIVQRVSSPETGLNVVTTPAPLRETAWFLGAYTHSLAVSGPQLGNLDFVYSEKDSLPTGQISPKTVSTGSSTSRTFDVGLFGETGTIGAGQTTSVETSVAWTIFDWEWGQRVGQRTIAYDWWTNDPISWGTITGGGGGPWELNDLNTRTFGPSSVTTWKGPYTYGKVSVASERLLQLVDHYSQYANGKVSDHFAIKRLSYGASPDEVTPAQSNVGPGIDFCDSNILVTAFIDKCKEYHPAPAGQTRLTIGVDCNDGPGNVDLEVKNETWSVTCPSFARKDFTVTSGNPAEITAAPTGLALRDLQCYDQSWTSFAHVFDSPQYTVPGGRLVPDGFVVCDFRFIRRPG